MDAVGKVQPLNAGHAVEEERIERHAVLLGEAWIDPVEGAGVVGAVVGRRQHAGEDDRHAARLQARHDVVQGALRDRGIDAAQRIVRAELDDDEIRPVLDRPVEAGLSGTRRIAGHGRVLDHDIEPLRLQLALQDGIEGRALRQPVAGGEAVPEGCDADAFRLRGDRGGEHRREQPQAKAAGRLEITHRRLISVAQSRSATPPLKAAAPPMLDRANPPAILLDDVHLKLGQGASRVHILKGISLLIPRGEAVGLVGPSGSGKSTLLMTLAGLERADSGKVEIDGQDLGLLNEDGLARFRGRRIGIVFQSFHLIPTMTALENVAVPLELGGVPNAFDRAAAELKAVGLGERLSHYPGQLSGGEQQRVALARALAPDPAILVADEPTGNLDGGTGEQIIELLFRLKRERGATLVLVTHDLDLARRCDRTVRIRSGLIESDTVAA